MNEYMYVDGQSVILLDGQAANIDLEYDETTDTFYVTADCDNWVSDYMDLMEKYYPEEDPLTETVENAINDCKKISGRYFTLKEINEVLEKYCEYSSYYDFEWYYTDGTPVE